MKKILKELVLLFVIVFGVLALTGCGKKLKTVTYNDKSKVSVSLSFEEEKGYELSESKDDLRTSLEDAVLKGDDFNIAIQVDEYSSNKTFNDVKNIYKKNNDYKEVTYNEMKGISFYSPSYVRYEVILNVDNKTYVSLHIYNKKSPNKEEDVKKIYNSEEVQEILNSVTINK